MKKQKPTVKAYECKKCNKLVYFMPEDAVLEKCKTCGKPLVFCYENPYNPKNGLRAVKSVSSSTMIPQTKSVEVNCPYCNSSDTKKITTTSRLLSMGFFGLASGKVGKQWHCNSCKSDF
ncbi:MAG: hypothetical protein IJA10_04080 [Lachnospiraceae bacterium]|nr:hypothetical protein [Lachnospiraceae bacterium]